MCQPLRPPPAMYVYVYLSPCPVVGYVEVEGAGMYVRLYVCSKRCPNAHVCMSVCVCVYVCVCVCVYVCVYV